MGGTLESGFGLIGRTGSGQIRPVKRPFRIPKRSVFYTPAENPFVQSCFTSTPNHQALIWDGRACSTNWWTDCRGGRRSGDVAAGLPRHSSRRAQRDDGGVKPPLRSAATPQSSRECKHGS